jgi:hypothetical protein
MARSFRWSFGMIDTVVRRTVIPHEIKAFTGYTEKRMRDQLRLDSFMRGQYGIRSFYGQGDGIFLIMR